MYINMPRIAGKRYAKKRTTKRKAPMRRRATTRRAPARSRAGPVSRGAQTYVDSVLKAVGAVGGSALAHAVSAQLGGGIAGDLVRGAVDVGRQGLSWGLNTIFGSGDYSMVRNSLVGPSGDMVPFMHSMKDGVRIRHREFLGDISSSILFTNQSFSMNPGLAESFPWLSAIAQNFEEYRFEGLAFEFKTTSSDALNSTNTALGTVILCAEYNVNQPAFVNKQQMENTMWAVSTKPSCSILMPIECAPSLNPLSNQFVRTGAVTGSQDLRLYDLCNVQAATVGSQAASVIGELWLTYDVVLLKPQLSSGLNLSGESAHYSFTGASSTGPFGTSQTELYDSIGLTFSNNSLNSNLLFPLGSQGKYVIDGSYVGGAVSLSSPSITFINCTSQAVWNGQVNQTISNAGSTGGTYIRDFVISIPDPTVQAMLTYSTGGTLPTSITTADLIVTQINDNLI